MGIPLRIAEPTGVYNRQLRRFTYSARADKGKDCPNTSWGHNATADIGNVTEAESERTHGDNWPHDDISWPTNCQACGYVFGDEDQWQRNDNPIYSLLDGSEFVFRHSFGTVAPPGTIARIPWYDEYSQHPDGVDSWIVSLPDGGEWITSQRASGGGFWKVTGTPPNITVTPSIWHNANGNPPGWHGFITNGELVQ